MNLPYFSWAYGSTDFKTLRTGKYGRVVSVQTSQWDIKTESTASYTQAFNFIEMF